MISPYFWGHQIFSLFFFFFFLIRKRACNPARFNGNLLGQAYLCKSERGKDPPIYWYWSSRGLTFLFGPGGGFYTHRGLEGGMEYTILYVPRWFAVPHSPIRRGGIQVHTTAVVRDQGLEIDFTTELAALSVLIPTLAESPSQPITMQSHVPVLWEINGTQQCSQ